MRNPGWNRAPSGILLAALLLAPGPGWAASWLIAPEQSSVEFEYQRNGQPAIGRFAVFSGEGSFDPGAPAKATFELRIESASIDLDDTLASAFATSAEWFDSKNHPQVVYRLLRLTPDGGDSYRADGELTIRGRSLPIKSLITLEISDGEAHASGTLGMDRVDYLLGVGPMSLFVDIGRQVAVRFTLTARPLR